MTLGNGYSAEKTISLYMGGLFEGRQILLFALRLTYTRSLEKNQGKDGR